MYIKNLDQKKKFFDSLDEASRRRYAAIEAQELGYGGVTLVSEFFEIDANTIRRGVKELESEAAFLDTGIRRSGGGRKKKVETEPALPCLFAEVVDPYRGGLPQDEDVQWVGLSPAQIQRKLADRGTEISFYMITQLLAAQGFVKRSYLKAAPTKQSFHRNEQFGKIDQLKARFLEARLPVLSIDTKQKELIGNFARAGSYYDTQFRKVNDHDFRSSAEGIMVPHGIYDLADNHGYITLGNSKDTSQFVCDNLEIWWRSDLEWKYPEAEWMLILCDGGGSNSARNYIVKQDFYQLAQRIQMNILIAHYPPYCSKYNPIEHRLFSQVHREWKGAVFHRIEVAEALARETTTRTGLKVKTTQNLKTYHTQRAVSPMFKQNIHEYIHFDEDIPELNYYVKHQKTELIF